MAGRRRKVSALLWVYRGEGGSVWQRITVYVLVRLAGAYGTVQMLESRGYGIEPLFRSIAAYRRWSPIPRRRIPFSQVAIRACSRATMAGRGGSGSAPMGLCQRSG